MLTSGALPLVLTGLATAASAAAIPTYSTESTSQGFRLIANATDLSRSFSAQIHRSYFSTMRFAPGIQSVILQRNSSTSSPAFNNGTASLIAARNGTINFDFTPPSTPLGLDVSPRDASLPDADYVSVVTVRYGYGSHGLGVDEEGVVYGPGKGTFIACNETGPGAPIHPTVSWAAVKTVGGEEVQDVPGNCVPFTFLAECAALPDVGDGAEYDHLFAQKVKCLKGLSSLSRRGRRVRASNKSLR